MSAAATTTATTTLSAACPSCATEIGLDAFMRLCINDEQMRGLVADLVAISLPLSADVLRYLRMLEETIIVALANWRTPWPMSPASR